MESDLEVSYRESVNSLKRRLDYKRDKEHTLRAESHLIIIQSILLNRIDVSMYNELIKDPFVILYTVLTVEPDMINNEDFILFKSYILNRYKYEELYDSLYEIIIPNFIGTNTPSIMHTCAVCLDVISFTNSESIFCSTFGFYTWDMDKLVLSLIPILAENPIELFIGSESIYYMPNIESYMKNNEILDSVREDRESQMECMDETNMFELAYSLIPNSIFKYFIELTEETIRYFKGSLPPSSHLFFKVFLRKAQEKHKELYGTVFLLDYNELSDLEYTCTYIWFYAYGRGFIYDYYIALSLDVFRFDYFKYNLLNHIIINATTLRILEKGVD